MGECGVVYRLPEGALLQVEYLVGRAVAATCLFTVGIDNFPAFARYGLAVGIQYIEFGDGGNVVSIVVGRGIQAEVASLHGGSKLHFLPAVARLESTLVGRFLGVELQGLSVLAMRFGSLCAKHVENRFLKADHLCLGRTFQIEDDDFVLTFLQPASGHVECLLGTDFPEAAHRMSVHPNHTLAPCLHVKEGVACLVQAEGGAIVGGTVYCLSLLIILVADEFVERRQIIY